MGSTGTSSFSDYPGSSGGKKKAGDTGSAGGGGAGVACEQPVESHLDEIGSGEYYVRQRALPPSGTAVRLRKALFSGRLAVENEDGLIIGYLPTAFNYLRQCLEQGYAYSGRITNTSEKPIPSVQIALLPTR